MGNSEQYKKEEILAELQKMRGFLLLEQARLEGKKKDRVEDQTEFDDSL